MPATNSQEYTNFPEQHLGSPTGFNADRARQARKIDRVLELGGFDETLATPESSLAFIDSLDFETFESLLMTMNGILINVPRSHRAYVDQLQMISDGVRGFALDIPPPPEIKNLLLGEVLNTAQHSAQSLEDKAMVIAVGVNAVHPFVEGNGRVARGIYHLLTNGYKPNDPRLTEIMSENGENIVTPDPNVLRPAIMSQMKIDCGTHVYNQESLGVTPLLPGMIDSSSERVLSQTALEGTDYEKQVLGILMQKDMAEMIPLLLIQQQLGSPAVKDALVSVQGQTYFNLTSFWSNRKAEDLNLVYGMLTGIKEAYVHRLLNELAAGEQSSLIVSPEDLSPIPMARLMKLVISRSISLDANVVSADEPSSAGTEGSVAQPKLTRQQRRAKARSDAKKSK